MDAESPKDLLPTLGKNPEVILGPQSSIPGYAFRKIHASRARACGIRKNSRWGGMSRTKYTLQWGEITISDIEELRSHLKPEENAEMKRKMLGLFSCMGFANFESQAAAEKAFTMGYLAAHMEYLDGFK